MTKLRILIAEDDALIAMLLGDILSDMGHEVCATTDTQADTVIEAARTSPDLMIVDANLFDGGSGVSAVGEILKTRFIPCIFVTGDPMQIEPLMPGAIVIQKPYTPRHLVQAINRVLGQSVSAPLA